MCRSTAASETCRPPQAASRHPWSNARPRPPEVPDVKLIHLLGAIPFLGILGGIFFVNRVTPYVLGMPFNLFWLVMWIVLISATMAVIYRLDPANREGESS
jgi:hypothetical protein